MVIHNNIRVLIDYRFETRVHFTCHLRVWIYSHSELPNFKTYFAKSQSQNRNTNIITYISSVLLIGTNLQSIFGKQRGLCGLSGLF